MAGLLAAPRARRKSWGERLASRRPPGPPRGLGARANGRALQHPLNQHFAEVVVGAAGFAAAVRKAGVEVDAFTMRRPDRALASGFDMLALSDFRDLSRRIRRRRYRWIHFAPPYWTFSRARRRSLRARVAVLRSSKQPYGIGERLRRPRCVTEDNALAVRTARLAKVQIRAGFSFPSRARRGR